MLSGLMPATYGMVIGTQGVYESAPLAGAFGALNTIGATSSIPLYNGAATGNLPAGLAPHGYPTPSIQSFSTEVQREFYYGTVPSVGYVGTLGRRLPTLWNLNAAMPGSGIAGMPFNALGRTTPVFFYNNGLTDNYNSLQVKLSKRFEHGISFNASYTYAKALGYTSADGLLLNPFNFRSNYGPLDYDRQHVLTISHVWELPFGRNGNGLIQTLAGGWQVNGIFTWATGTPLTITSDPLVCACSGNTPFASVVVGVSTNLYGGSSYLNPGAFTPAGNQGGNLARGVLRGPGFRTYDLSLLKNFKVYERVNAQLRAEAYNLFNTPRFANPVTNVNAADVGQLVSTLNGGFGRQINLGLRIRF